MHSFFIMLTRRRLPQFGSRRRIYFRSFSGIIKKITIPTNARCMMKTRPFLLPLLLAVQERRVRIELGSGCGASGSW